MPLEAQDSLWLHSALSGSRFSCKALAIGPQICRPSVVRRALAPLIFPVSTSFALSAE